MNTKHNQPEKSIEEIVEEINLNIRKNCNAMICSVCGGGGYDYDKGRDCTECLASGITNWDFDFLNKKLTQTLQAERQKRGEVVRLDELYDIADEIYSGTIPTEVLTFIEALTQPNNPE